MMVEGKGYREICDELDIPPSAIGRHKQALKRIANETLETDAHCVRLVEEARLETLTSTYWASALSGDLRAGEFVLRIHAARAKMWGLAELQDTKKPSEVKAKLLAALLDADIDTKEE